MLAAPVPLEGLKPVAGRRAQVFERSSAVQQKIGQPFDRAKAQHVLVGEQTRRRRLLERADHKNDIPYAGIAQEE